jgi:hypothetical protein
MQSSKSSGAKKENGDDRETKSLHEPQHAPLVPTVTSDKLSGDRQIVVVESFLKAGTYIELYTTLGQAGREHSRHSVH